MDGVVGFVTIKGDGLAVGGPCLLCGLILWPDDDADYCTVYDGLDATSGKKFARIEAAGQTSKELLFPHPVRFDHGVYVDGLDSAVETTVIFSNVE